MQNLAYDYDSKYFAQLAVTESYFNRYADGRDRAHTGRNHI